jgi:hypothetical protein
MVGKDGRPAPALARRAQAATGRGSLSMLAGGITMQAVSWGESGAEGRTLSAEALESQVGRAAVLSREAAAAVEALFGPWEAQLEASVRRLSALQTRLDAQARRLSGLETELASLSPSGTAWSSRAT